MGNILHGNTKTTPLIGKEIQESILFKVIPTHMLLGLNNYQHSFNTLLKRSVHSKDTGNQGSR